MNDTDQKFLKYMKYRYGVYPMAYLVDSVEDIPNPNIFKDKEDPLDPFGIFFLETENGGYILDMKVYINKNLQEIYLVPTNVENIFYSQPKPFFKKTGTLKVNNIEKDLENYVDNILVPDLKEYCKDLAPEKQIKEISYIVDGDFSRLFSLFKNIFKPHKTILVITDQETNEIKVFNIFDYKVNNDQSDFSIIIYKNYYFFIDVDEYSDGSLLGSESIYGFQYDIYYQDLEN